MESSDGAYVLHRAIAHCAPRSHCAPQSLLSLLIVIFTSATSTLSLAHMRRTKLKRSRVRRSLSSARPPHAQLLFVLHIRKESNGQRRAQDNVANGPHRTSTHNESLEVNIVTLVYVQITLLSQLTHVCFFHSQMQRPFLIPRTELHCGAEAV